MGTPRADLALPSCAVQVALDFEGNEEWPGNRGPMVQLFADLVGVEEGIPWCFTGDVELLTEAGFVRFDDLERDLRVAQVDPDSRRVSFVEPTGYIEHERTGQLATLDSRDFSLTCDARHRFFGNWGNPYYGSDELRPISEIGGQLSIPTVRTHEREDPEWSDRDLRLLAVFLADGSFHYGRISVQVSRPHKKRLLGDLDPRREHEASRAYGRSKRALTTFEFDVPDAFEAAFETYKQPSHRLLATLSQRQVRVFLETYVMLDGNGDTKRSSSRIYTSDIYLRDWLQVAITLAGYHSSWHGNGRSPISGRPSYTISYSTQKKSRTISNRHVQLHHGTEELYCVEVPSGLIVIRDPKGTVTVTGNCAAFVYGCLDIACALKNDRYNPLQEVRHKALVQSIYDYADAAGWIVPDYDATVGDLVLFDFGRTSRDWEHIGFVRSPPRDGTDFTSVEGNTGAGSDREGKYVSVRDRVVGPDVCFIRYV